MERARSSITEVHEAELRKLANRVLELLPKAKKEDLPILDYVVGALHALLRARQLKFKNRRGRLADRYWRRGPTDTARALYQGLLRADGRWLAGFYFNSALARIAATFERFMGVARASRRGAKAREAEERRVRGRCPNVLLVVKDVNRLKHERPGLAGGRTVGAAETVAAIREVVELAETVCRPGGAQASEREAAAQ